MIRKIFLIFAILLFVGCSSHQPLVVSKYQIVNTHDTIRNRDSIDRWHTERIKGDTVFIHDSIDRWHTREKIVIEHTCDSVPYEVEVIKEIRKPSGWDYFASGVTILLIIAIVIYIVIKAVKRWTL